MPFILRATTSFVGADASAHLLHRDLQGGGDSEVGLLVKWEQQILELEGCGIIYLLECLAKLVRFAFEEMLGAFKLPWREFVSLKNLPHLGAASWG